MKDDLLKVHTIKKGDVTMKQNNVNYEQQQLHSLLPLGEGGRRPDEGLKETAECNGNEMLKQSWLLALNGSTGCSAGSTPPCAPFALCSQSAVQDCKS